VSVEKRVAYGGACVSYDPIEYNINGSFHAYSVRAVGGVQVGRASRRAENVMHHYQHAKV
jgi:hypothetical protein